MQETRAGSRMVVDGEARIDPPPLLTAAEREQLLSTFNDTGTGPYPERLIHQVFEEQVARSPSAIALVYEEQSLTFAELNRRANQLARRLRTQGVGPDRLVGVCLERSIEQLVAVLAVFKAGGAYLPLDPDYPPERTSYILTDAAPHVVLTRSRLQKAWPSTVSCITLDGRSEAIPAEEGVNLDPSSIGVTPHHLAYVIYTSGSTGKPNGVMVEHRSVVNHWHVIARLYRQPFECERIAVNAPLTFDVSVQQYVLLLSGCTLFIIPEASRKDAARLLCFLETNLIQGVDCTPSQLSVWVSAGLLERSGYGLRTVIVGGEAFEAPLWAQLTYWPNIAFYNVYGPTECTVFSTAARLGSESSSPHIGAPTDNARIYILDTEQNLVPVGAPGEIYIGGVGVARGYLNRTELTRSRFMTAPFVHDRNARMYKTGDLGQWRADGTIEFLGRCDEQLKIRGYRIEPGEVEAQIRQYAPVSDAVVISREDAPGERRLVAYVTVKERADFSAEHLSAHLAHFLPEYMMPSALVVLQSLPLTPNGKLDRRALPMPGVHAPASQQSELPREGLEEALAQIWREVLRVNRIGRRDKFLELGGHSVQGMRLVVRIAERFGIQMSFPDVFQYPTVREMAEIVQDRQRQKCLAGAQELAASGNPSSGMSA